MTLTDNLRCWGWNSDGQTSVPADLGKVQAVTTGDRDTCALTWSNTLRCWGAGGNNNVPSILNLSSPTEFQTSNLGNGHYYLAALDWTGSWDEARLFAESSRYKNLSGHLVTISSSAENEFVRLMARGQNIFTAGRGNRVQDGTKGVWSWQGGPEDGITISTCVNGNTPKCIGSYSNWDQSSLSPSKQPDLGDAEDTIVQFNKIFLPGGWHDCPGISGACDVSGFVIEYEPLTIILSPTPLILGRNYVGQELSVDEGTWDQGVSLTYQWFRDELPIVGATGKKYILTSADYLKKITVQASGLKYSSVRVEKVSSPVLVLKAKDSMAGILIKGSNEVAGRLVAKPTHSSSKLDYTYQWFRDGQAIDGATYRNYQLTAQDAQKIISHRICITLAGVSAECMDQSLEEPVRLGILKNVRAAKTGFAKPNRTLTAGKAHSSSDAAVSYQWLRDSTPISGATSKTYLVSSTDLGAQISIQVTVRKDGYVSEIKASLSKTIVP